ncbi:hypothetical protein [Kitasatospora sp. NPDC059327]|uniref:hypothetical protein n=1 Tax=Kitasatospora sp. NPDC059327 TaxID=3346803 RepID=UPI0036C0AC72
MHVVPSAVPPANQAGLRWLAGFHRDRAACLDSWAAGGLAEIPLVHLAAVQVSATIGIRALRRLEPIGPVLHSVGRGTVEFFVAPTTMVVDRPGVRVLTQGSLLCPPPGRAVERRRAPVWLAPPDGVGRLMDIRRVLDAVAAQYAFFATLPPDYGAPAPCTAVGTWSTTAAVAFVAAGRRATGRTS